MRIVGFTMFWGRTELTGGKHEHTNATLENAAEKFVISDALISVLLGSWYSF